MDYVVVRPKKMIYKHFLKFNHCFSAIDRKIAELNQMQEITITIAKNLMAVNFQVFHSLFIDM